MRIPPGRHRSSLKASRALYIGEAGKADLPVAPRRHRRQKSSSQLTECASVPTSSPAAATHPVSDPCLHFGLGSATKVDKLEILWPDGKNEQIPAPRWIKS